jgi:hypothetical protein
MSDEIQPIPDEAEMTVGPKAIDAYSRLSYSMWFALAEFVDNSTQSRLNYDKLVDDILKSEGTLLTVNILHNRQSKEITIDDNSIGMSKADLIAALKIATPTADSHGRSKYGMGMKTAACWIGKSWSVITCEFGSGEEWTAKVDVDAIANRGAKVPLTLRQVDTGKHYTKIVISELRRTIQTRSEEVIKDYLGSMYMFDLRPDENGVTALKLTYNGEPINPPAESNWDTDPAGTPMMKQLPELKLGEKTINGWVGVLRKGGRKYGGFSFFLNKRQIQGFPTAWKPRAIFGGVDEEGANNLISQRLTGCLLLDGFDVTHTKDAVLFEDNEEDDLEKFLVKEVKDYRDHANKPRKGVQVWSKEKVRDLVETMRSEFCSDETQDALNHAALPPIEIIEANNVKQLESLSVEDELVKLEILPELTVIVSLKEISEWEPYVTFVTAAQKNIVHVIINGIHPYYRSLESSDAIEECIHQYIYDAVAEYRTGQLQGRTNPNSVRRIKNDLLRARTLQIENTAASIREQAEMELFEDSAAPKD